MSKARDKSVIRLRGVRHNNLKNFDLDLPVNRLIVITGLSGSGKSSLAFDTLFAEGQRRYIETFSPYARQFFDRMDKPQVDSIEGIPPAIAIEQRNSVRSTRSTVGTLTEICDYMKVLWPHIAKLHCKSCGKPVRKDSPQDIWASLISSNAQPDAHEFLITFNIPISEKLSLEDSVDLIIKQGYLRCLIDGAAMRFEDALENLKTSSPDFITVVQDRIKISPELRSRFVEACEQAYHFGKGHLALHTLAPGAKPLLYSNKLHCAECNIDYRDPSPALFSFNHPVGACPACKGFGRVITIDYNLALPDRSKTLLGGAVKPWQTGMSAECQSDLAKFCRLRKVPMDVPFNRLSASQQDWVINGDKDYGKDKQHEWPKAWYGIRGYFKWLESKSYKMHVRVLLSRYRKYTLCPDCGGNRFQPESLLYRIPRLSASGASSSMTLSQFYQLPVAEALELIGGMAKSIHKSKAAPILLALGEVRARLGFLDQVGLGYLTVDRPTRSLSGGETERVSLTTCLGSRLVNTLFVLDEPSVGLHPRDTERLTNVLHQLRDAGNTIVVVEHEASVMLRADQIIDIGPGHGSTGGNIVFQGSPEQLLQSDTSLTGKYLSGQAEVGIPQRRAVTAPATAKATGTQWLSLTGASLHNIKNLNVNIPLGRLVCLTGVSGSGKTTLAREILFPTLLSAMGNHADEITNEDAEQESGDNPDSADLDTQTIAKITGHESLGSVVLVDQSGIAKTPRSNPAVFIGAFDFIRDIFAKSEIAKQHGLTSGSFSYNSPQGQCEKCRGAGFEKIEMQFLSDVFIRCNQCDGKRYRPHILDIRIASQDEEKNIAEILSSTVDEAVDFLSKIEESKDALRAVEALKFLQEVGLGYLQLGQPVNTLSGGENQRLKLVRNLVEFASRKNIKVKPTLFLFDEPTTGLHFEDVRILLMVFQRLVDAGHTVIIIEHNLDVIKSADWLIDLGPEAGSGGGNIVVEGTPEQVASCAKSHTGKWLQTTLKARSKKNNVKASR